MVPPRTVSREQILAAAERVVAERGYAGATTKAIAREAQCSEGSLYNHFPDKRELFRAVYEETEKMLVGALSARVADIDFVKRQLCVQRSAWKGFVASPKGGRLRYIPLTTRLAAALRDHRHLRGPLVLYQADGSPLTEGLVQGLVKRAALKAGVFNNGPHMLRHTFCSHLAMRGAPARAIQELAGHQNLTTTQRYMHLSPAALDGAIRLLEPPEFEKFRGDILETADRENAKSNV